MADFKQCPRVYTLAELTKIGVENNPSSSRDGAHYVSARPLNPGWRWERLKTTWLVWQGRADAVVWPQGQ
jgi:hypothetical protein